MRLKLAIAFLAFSALSQAQTLNMSLFSTAHAPGGQEFVGVHRDRSTGHYWVYRHYQSTTIDRFTNIADFQNNSNGTTTTLANGHLGTYHFTLGNKLYARSGVNGNEQTVTRFDALTGAVETTVSFGAYSGSNGTHTFDWGGYSGFNLYDDGTGTGRMLARDNGNQWHILKLDSNFNVQQDHLYGNTSTSTGFAFVVGGYMFIGNSFFSPTITHKVNLTTGVDTAVNFNFAGLGGSVYLSNMSYDPLSNQLFVVNQGTQPSNPGIYVLDGAAEALGVPEPGTMAALGVGVVALLRRRRRN